MRETRKNHGDGVIRGKREIGLSDVGFELIDDGGENWV